ncbi:MAG: BamA/TamA family outer membrane protein, partial [Planctomycetota bacterium]
QDKVIRRVLDSYDFQPGKLYNGDVAPKEGGGQLEQEIRRTILAEEVTITPLAGVEPGQKNVEVNIKEGETGFIMFGGGIGSDSGVMGQLILEQRNFDINDWPESLGEFITGRAFKGAGQHLRIALQPGTELSEHLISFTEPHFQDKPISLNVVGSSWERERESYDEGRLKGYTGLRERYERRYRDRWRRSIAFRVENVDVDSIDFDAPKEIKEVKGKNALVGLKIGLGRDLTNDRYNPSEGYYLDGSYEQVTGDQTFGILSGTFTRYSTIYEDLAERRTILATKVHAGTVFGDAPAFEKFYAGGMASIRGFEYRGVSTRGTPEVGGVPVAGAKKKDPIGSDWVFLANAEVAVPIVREEVAALFFVDSGTIDSGSYRVSVGTGIQIMIPQWFGPVPMRVGVATPFLKDDSDDTEAFFFYMGRLF